ncbi:MAG: hypothetical protein OXC31_30280 [Spirochaetaceae bacterium]|nr:hypothetical protein [Spirochaetaceae bacterium]
MGRLIGGCCLIAVGLFVLLGFTQADVAGGPATVVALLIGAGLPVAGGAWLIAGHLGAGRVHGERREALRRETLESEVLRLAGRHTGRLTAVEVAGELAVSPAAAEEALHALALKKVADLEITDSGVLVYVFHEVLHASEKDQARRLLDS